MVADGEPPESGMRGPMNTLNDLAKRWRSDAQTLRDYGDLRGATVVEALAVELEDAIREVDQEVVTMTEASEVSGYSKRRLRELVNAGDLDNVGRKGAPRFRRGDLPAKPGKPKGGGSYDPSDDARAILGRIEGGR